MTAPRGRRFSWPGVLASLLVCIALAWWGAAPDCAGGFIMFCLPRGLIVLLPSWLLADAMGETGGLVWWTVLTAGSLATLALLLAVPYVIGATAASLLRRRQPVDRRTG